MDNFKYRIQLEAIDKLTTKKAVKELFQELLYTDDSVNGFKALTYLLKVHKSKLTLGRSANKYITDKLLRIAAAYAHDINDLVKYCTGDFALSENHKDKIMHDRIIPFQVVAAILKQGT